MIRNFRSRSRLLRLISRLVCAQARSTFARRTTTHRKYARSDHTFGGVKMADACTRGLDTGFIALGHAKVAVLGIVQGITELLPISSTAHMRIVPALLGWPDPGSAFSAAMQLAALAAVVSYFWRDVRDILFGSLAAL